MNIQHTRQCGFSLIEALISAVLLAVVIMALTRLQVNMLADSGTSRIRTHALNLAHQKLEEMRAFSRHDLYQGLSSGSDQVAAASAQLSRSWSLSSGPGYVVANVTVSWDDQEGVAQSVALSSYINAADPVRSGKVLLASVAVPGGGSGVGSGNGDENGDEEGTGAGSEEGGAADDGGSATGEDGSDTAGDGEEGAGDEPVGGGASGSAITLENYAECTANICLVGKGSTIIIRFQLGAGGTLEPVVVTGGAEVVTQSDYQVSVKTPSGNNKSFTVGITAGDQTLTLQFKTTNK